MILFPPTFHRLILLMFGAFHENQQHCKTILTEKLYWWKLDFAIIVVSHYCHLIKDYKRFIFIVMKDVFLLGMLNFDSGERCILVRNAKNASSVSRRKAMLSRGQYVWRISFRITAYFYSLVFLVVHTCCYTIKCVRLWNRKGQSLTFKIIWIFQKIFS